MSTSPGLQVYTAPAEPFYECNPPMVLGEAPIYRASDSTLHWVDCLANPPEFHILKIDPQTQQPIGQSRRLMLTDSVTVHFFRKSHPGSYICAYYQGIAFLDEKTGKLDIVKEIIPTTDRGIRRFNDGGVDAKGRFWLAEIDLVAASYGANKLPKNYGEPLGRLWRYDADGSLQQMEKGVICGNGLGWSPDNKTMYFHDSVGMMVFAYDFDLESGSISNKRLLIDRRNSYGEPDGMVVDMNGNLWIAMYSSWRVMAFDATGKHLVDVIFPSYNMACTTWGGPNFDTLYIASGKDRSADPKGNDKGGHIYAFKPPNAKGSPKHEFAG
ncbi:hypothetical protein AC579_382 [Pseudocercospora musae]|uniref:SMP-30/Gluconolactonase/LRE-like region domain-containing protein n=1 Tax=Pseudocercospora musae TaxID=113226 RepID=A0A139IDD2_9PEZI|nr:hypothetical protein AC579_382 [Pseudocercospora musae]